MVMVMMTVMVLGLLPEWSHLPTATQTPPPTAPAAETPLLPVTFFSQPEATPDEGLDRLGSLEVIKAPASAETVEDEVSSEAYPYYLNDPDNRVSRAQ